MVKSRLFPVILQAGMLALVGLLALNGLGLGSGMSSEEFMPFRKTHLTTLVVWGLWWPGMIAVALAAIVATTWSFSAFTVLVYYALTNLSALRLPAEERRFPRIVPLLGLGSCLGLVFWVEPTIWAAGLGLIGAGLIWHFLGRSRIGNRV